MKVIQYLALACIILHLSLTVLVSMTSGSLGFDKVGYYAVADFCAGVIIAYYALALKHYPKKFKIWVVVLLNAAFAVWFLYIMVIFSLYAAKVPSLAKKFEDMDVKLVVRLVVVLAVVSGLIGALFATYSVAIAAILLRRCAAAANSHRRRASGNPVPVAIPLINLPRLPPPTIHHNPRLNNPYHPLGMSPSNSSYHVPVIPREMV
ncbi:hypothetical protein BKA65DRAFT_541596 [Rhexocercosporidium sp. MPI-PUGE-AT-0058]|nr:hypothetical protein BKA65DRAFT_541596 [Rhexocercosporidium sp. MPI-PUGE-AT-0058]